MQNELDPILINYAFFPFVTEEQSKELENIFHNHDNVFWLFAFLGS